MQLGRLGDATADFNRAIGPRAVPERSQARLALVLAYEGNTVQAQNTYLDGMWRFKPKRLVFCSNSRDDDVRPPVDEMFDTSMGIDGGTGLGGFASIEIVTKGDYSIFAGAGRRVRSGGELRRQERVGLNLLPNPPSPARCPGLEAFVSPAP